MEVTIKICNVTYSVSRDINLEGHNITSMTNKLADSRVILIKKNNIINF